MRSFKKLVSIALIGSLFCSMVGCGKTSEGGGEKSSSDTIYIGTSFPQSGNIASEGKQLVNAIQLAVDQVNADGGINGKKVALKSEDDEGDATTAASIANKFGDDSDILGVIMSYNSACALAQIPILEGAGLVSVSPTAESPSLTGMSDWFYRTCCSNAYSGVVCAKLCENLGLKKVAIIYQNDDYGQGLKDAFKGECDNLGISVETEQTYVQAETVDFSTQLTAISDTSAEGVFIAGYTTEAGLICSQKDAYNCGDLTFVGGVSVYADEIFDYDGTDGLYSLGGFSLTSEDEAVKKFIADYKEAYGSTPSSWSAYAYDAAMVMLEGMKSCGDDLSREALKDAIAASDYQGVTGENKFVNGDVEKEYNWYVTANGEWTEVKH